MKSLVSFVPALAVLLSALIVVFPNASAHAQTMPGPGGALRFDGLDDYVQVPETASLTLSNAVTFEAWVHPEGDVCTDTILSRGHGGTAATDYIFQLGYDGASCAGRKLAFFGAGAWDASISPIPSNTWTHVAVTFDGTNKRFYINGVL